MLPITERWARWGSTNRKWFVHVPRGGVCLSAFLIVRNRRGDVLFGRPQPHSTWPERGCLPRWRVDEINRNEEWILPASHLMMAESPDRAARRIAREWAGLPHAKLRFIGIDSSQFPMGGRVGRGRTRRRVYHWTLCFLYEARSERSPRPSPKWKVLTFIPKKRIRGLRIGRFHRDVLLASERSGSSL
jgi:ADP-ribose pyrophosphatase YjhB (NUDIX family)